MPSRFDVPATLRPSPWLSRQSCFSRGRSSLSEGAQWRPSSRSASESFSSEKDLPQGGPSSPTLGCSKAYSKSLTARVASAPPAPRVIAPSRHPAFRRPSEWRDPFFAGPPAQLRRSSPSAASRPNRSAAKWHPYRRRRPGAPQVVVRFGAARIPRAVVQAAVVAPTVAPLRRPPEHLPFSSEDLRSAADAARAAAPRAVRLLL